MTCAKIALWQQLLGETYTYIWTTSVAQWVEHCITVSGLWVQIPPEVIMYFLPEKACLLESYTDVERQIYYITMTNEILQQHVI